MTLSVLAFDVLLAGMAGFLATYAAFSIVSRRTVDRPSPDTTRLLFDKRTLIDATLGASDLLADGAHVSDDLGRFAVALAPVFPDLPSALDDDHSTHLTSVDGESDLQIERDGEQIRVTLTGARPDRADAAACAAQEAELDLLRTNTDCAPFVAWREDSTGQITWMNRGYLDLAREVVGAERAGVWPLPALFREQGNGDDARQSVDIDGKPTRWFQIRAMPTGGDILRTAIDVTDTVRAETRLQEFLQTLTQTFASLKIGLAIFNRDRNLVLYNPALVDLTGLPVDLLTAHPDLTTLLDALRERQMMPEPRDYREWRDAIAHLELASAEGNYSETWNLPDDRTYRVTGRPHPDGAIALLIEDISAEMSLTRLFRAELDLSQAVLDELDEAVAVFAPTGVLTMSNLAYGRLWGSRPDAEITDVSVTDATRIWAERSLPTPVWGDLRDYAADPGPRGDWSASVHLSDGRPLDCRFAPLAGGATMVTFRVMTAARADTETVALPPMRKIG